MKNELTPMQKWYAENKEQHKANVKAYLKTDRYKAYKRAYLKTDRYKANVKAYHKTDKYKAYQRAYHKAYYQRKKKEAKK